METKCEKNNVKSEFLKRVYVGNSFFRNNASNDHLYGDTFTVINKTGDLINLIKDRTKEVFITREYNSAFVEINEDEKIISHFDLLKINALNRNWHTLQHFARLNTKTTTNIAGNNCGDWFYNACADNRYASNLRIDIPFSSIDYYLLTINYVLSLFIELGFNEISKIRIEVADPFDFSRRVNLFDFLKKTTLEKINIEEKHTRDYLSFFIEVNDKKDNLTEILSPNQLMFFMSMVRSSYITKSRLPKIWSIIQLSRSKIGFIETCVYFNENPHYSHLPLSVFNLDKDFLQKLLSSLEDKHQRLNCQSLIGRFGVTGGQPSSRDGYDWVKFLNTNRAFKFKMREYFLVEKNIVDSEILSCLIDKSILEKKINETKNKLQNLINIKENETKI